MDDNVTISRQLSAKRWTDEFPLWANLPSRLDALLQDILTWMVFFCYLLLRSVSTPADERDTFYKPVYFSALLGFCAPLFFYDLILVDPFSPIALRRGSASKELPLRPKSTYSKQLNGMGQRMTQIRWGEEEWSGYCVASHLRPSNFQTVVARIIRPSWHSLASTTGNSPSAWGSWRCECNLSIASERATN